jgi:hypothetical protein
MPFPDLRPDDMVKPCPAENTLTPAEQRRRRAMEEG